MSKQKTESSTVFEELNKRFHPSHIEWVIVNAIDFKAGNRGVMIKAFATPYIKKEVAERTADEVFGPHNWENGYDMPDENGRVRYWIRFRKDADSEWVYRYDGSSIDLKATGGFASEAFEIALTFGEKRCWAKVGIGRYLKLVPNTEVEYSESWVEGWNYYSFNSKVNKGQSRKFYWQTPHLPKEALPEDFEYDSRPTGKEKTPPSPPKKEEATEGQWKIMLDYYMSVDDEEENLAQYLFIEEVDDSGEGGKKTRKKLSKQYATKLITSFEKGYGKLNKDGIPEKLAGQPKTDLQKEIEAEEARNLGVSEGDIKNTLGAEEEKK